VQNSEKVQSGEADMDDLCAQLKAKAKCSGSGAVIDQRDVDAILGPAPHSQKDFLKIFT
jgi:AP-1-like factor